MARSLELILVIVILALAGTLPRESTGNRPAPSAAASDSSLLPSLGVPLLR